MKDLPIMMKLKPASEYFGISYDRLRKMCLAGEVSYMRAGRDFLINRPRLEEYLFNANRRETENSRL